jgi:hypothetical protein
MVRDEATTASSVRTRGRERGSSGRRAGGSRDASVLPLAALLLTSMPFAACGAASAAAAVPAAPVASAPADAPVAPAGAITTPVGPSGIAYADAAEEGVWVRREYTFTYMGLTAYYSCDSLAGKLRILLDVAGARDDAKVSPRGCIDGPDRIQPVPSARMVFHVFVPKELAPQPPKKAEEKPSPPARQLGRDAPKLKRVDLEAEPGVGAWRRVEFDGRRPRRLEAGDCEVIEQFVRQVLPMFHTRNVQDDMRCTPGRVSASDVRLSFEALGAPPKADVTPRGSPRG